MRLSLPQPLIAGSLAVAAVLAATAPVSAGPPAPPPGPGPSAAKIAHRLAHTVEIGIRGTHFRAIGSPLTIKDGRGTGTLTAVIGGRYPTADGKGQVVFFWHNRRFIGLSADYETPAVAGMTSPAPGTFVIRYLRYRPSDPLCCPTLPPLAVTYGWSGHLLISNGAPPRVGQPVRVKYQP